MYCYPSLSVYTDIRGSLDRVCLLTGVCMWGSRDPSGFVFILLHILWARWVTFFWELWVIVRSIIMFVVDVTSFHVWSELIITPFDVIHFIIIALVFASDSSFSLHLLFLFLPRPSLGLIFSSHRHYTSHYQFDLLHLSPCWHYVHIRHHWVHTWVSNVG